MESNQIMFSLQKSIPCMHKDHPLEKFQHDQSLCDVLKKLLYDINKTLNVECGCNYLFIILYYSTKEVEYENKTFNFILWCNENNKLAKKIKNKLTPKKNNQNMFVKLKLKKERGIIVGSDLPIDKTTNAPYDNPSELYKHILNFFVLSNSCNHVYKIDSIQRRSNDEALSHIQTCTICGKNNVL